MLSHIDPALPLRLIARVRGGGWGRPFEKGHQPTSGVKANAEKLASETQRWSDDTYGDGVICEQRDLSQELDNLPANFHSRIQSLIDRNGRVQKADATDALRLMGEDWKAAQSSRFREYMKSGSSKTNASAVRNFGLMKMQRGVCKVIEELIGYPVNDDGTKVKGWTESRNQQSEFLAERAKARPQLVKGEVTCSQPMCTLISSDKYLHLFQAPAGPSAASGSASLPVAGSINLTAPVMTSQPGPSSHSNTTPARLTSTTPPPPSHASAYIDDDDDYDDVDDDAAADDIEEMLESVEYDPRSQDTEMLLDEFDRLWTQGSAKNAFQIKQDVSKQRPSM